MIPVINRGFHRRFIQQNTVPAHDMMRQPGYGIAISNGNNLRVNDPQRTGYCRPGTAMRVKYIGE